jgi:hypothetical protein
MSLKPDWDACAVKMANRAMTLLAPGERRVALDEVPEPGSLGIVVRVDADTGESLPSEYRPVGIAVLFGTDGYLQNPRARAQVHVVRQCLALKEIDVLGFGTNDRKRPLGRGWALVVRSDDLNLLGTILNAAHTHAFCKGTVIESVAEHYFEDLGIDPNAIPVNLDAFAG